jgi:hypothetical protein
MSSEDDLNFRDPKPKTAKDLENDLAAWAKTGSKEPSGDSDKTTVHEYADGSVARKTTVYLDPGIAKAVRVYAAMEDINRSDAINRLLAAALEDTDVV